MCTPFLNGYHRTAIVTIVKIDIFEWKFKCQSSVNKFDILYDIINYIERDNQWTC